jgi:hypothetical protein
MTDYKALYDLYGKLFFFINSIVEDDYSISGIKQYGLMDSDYINIDYLRDVIDREKNLIDDLYSMKDDIVYNRIKILRNLEEMTIFSKNIDMGRKRIIITFKYMSSIFAMLEKVLYRLNIEYELDDDIIKYCDGIELIKEFAFIIYFP